MSKNAYDITLTRADRDKEKVRKSKEAAEEEIYGNLNPETFSQALSKTTKKTKKNGKKVKITLGYKKLSSGDVVIQKVKNPKKATVSAKNMKPVFPGHPFFKYREEKDWGSVHCGGLKKSKKKKARG
jgi:hypothetical protein